MNNVDLLRETLKPHLKWHGARLSFLALFLIALFRVKKALKDLDRAISLDEQNSHAYHVRSGIYNLKEDWNKALKDLDRAIKLNPDRAANYIVRGNLYNRHFNKVDRAEGRL